MVVLLIRVGDSEESVLQNILDALSEKTSVQIINATTTPKEQHRLLFPGLEIRLAEQTVYLDGVLVPLSHYEFFTLCYLAEHPGWVFTKEQIYEAVWKEPGHACGAAVPSVISQFRRKLWPENPLGGYIRTVHNSGYKFEV